MIKNSVKVAILKLNIIKDMGYTYFYGREVLCQANREGPKEGKNYPGMAWREEVVYINERCRDKINSGTMVGIKEEIRSKRFLGANRWSERREGKENNGRDKGIYQRDKAVLSRGNEQGIEGIYSPQVWTRFKSWMDWQIAMKIGEKLHFGRPQRGRRDYSKGIPIDHAGVYFVKGADSDMEGVKVITEEIVKGREKDIDEKLALGRIRGTTPATIKKKVETLLYLPMFGMQKPYHLLKYHKRGLGILSGSGKRYSYYTTDIFLGDIEKLRISKEAGDALARCYLEALGIEIELEDGSYFYLDGHSKHLWSSKNIPKAFFTTLKRVERGLHQYFIHSSKGNPLILLTCPGDTRLPGALFNLIDVFENAVGKKIVKVAIFDREGLSLSIFEEFDERKPKKYFLTLLREDMYKGEESFKILKDFIPLKTVEKEGELKVLEWVAEAEYELKERKKKAKKGKKKEKEKKRIVRVALVKKVVDGKIKLIPIITNLTRKEERNTGRIAKRYFDRWLYQENMFKDAMEAIKVDTNHGYKKREVTNRVVLRKKEDLETNLRGIAQKLRKAKREKREVNRALTKLKEFYQTSKQICQKEINDLQASKRRIDVTLHFYDGPFLQKAVKYACMKFNESDRRTLEGQRIWMRVEGQNVKF